MAFLARCFAVLALCASAVSSHDTRRLRDAQAHVLQASADVTGNQCSTPVVPPSDDDTAKTTCEARKRAWAAGGCHVCPNTQIDERSTLTAINVCVAHTDHCVAVQEKHSNLNSHCGSTGAAGCGLTETMQLRRNWYANNEGETRYDEKSVAVSAGTAKIHPEIEKVSVLTTSGANTFFHVTTAADAIMTGTPTLLASKGGTAGGGNSAAATENCKGHVYMWVTKDGHRSAAELETAAKKALKTVKKGFGDLHGKTLEVIQIDVGANFVVEFDPDMPETVRHVGDVVHGQNGVALTKVVFTS